MAIVKKKTKTKKTTATAVSRKAASVKRKTAPKGSPRAKTAIKKTAPRKGINKGGSKTEKATPAIKTASPKPAARDISYNPRVMEPKW